MSGIRRLPVRDSSKSGYMMMRYVRNCEFDAGCSFLELLPLELQEKIFRMLSNSDLRNLTRVSKTLLHAVCESYILMNRFKFVVPSKFLLENPNIMIIPRKYSTVKFDDNISYNYAAKILPCLTKFGGYVRSVTIMKMAYSESKRSTSASIIYV